MLLIAIKNKVNSVFDVNKLLDEAIKETDNLNKEC